MKLHIAYEDHLSFQTALKAALEYLSLDKKIGHFKVNGAELFVHHRMRKQTEIEMTITSALTIEEAFKKKED